MEPINGNLTASSVVEPLSTTSADHVGGAFCRAFYTAACETRREISKFYGHESHFRFEGKVVIGAQEISKLYNSIPTSSHFKINSIKTLPTLHRQGIMVQVLGTLNFRPFAQTFVLGQQGQKKYYVELDHLQYLDEFFDVKSTNEKVVAETTPTVNGHSNGVNGNGVKAKPTEEPENKQKSIKPTVQKTQQTPTKEEAPVLPKQETPKAKEEPKVQKQTVQNLQQQQQAPQQPPQQQQQKAPVPTAEPTLQETPKPRTWAHLVGGGSKQNPPQQQQQQNYGQGSQLHQQQVHHIQQQANLHQHQPAQQANIFQQPRSLQQQSNNDLHQGETDNANLLERKIYLGGITREIVPSNTAQAETEIKQVFYKYGEVEEVRMPRKVLDSPNDTSKHAFAFITMRTKQGVQAIFADASRDEQGSWKLPLKLDAFGFDGLAQISEQRDQPIGGFRGGRGGGNFQSRGGPFFRRGGQQGGGAPRGGFRGGYQNGFNAVHH
uniref:Uncharacterized protein n=1 Tax=Caenorhabditis japonica TaxID=281687 RepID=A0A8R1HRJ8_CAEJA